MFVNAASSNVSYHCSNYEQNPLYTLYLRHYTYGWTEKPGVVIGVPHEGLLSVTLFNRAVLFLNRMPPKKMQIKIYADYICFWSLTVRCVVVSRIL